MQLCVDSYYSFPGRKHFQATAYAVLDHLVSPLEKAYSERDLDVVCTLRVGTGNKVMAEINEVRRRVVGWLHKFAAAHAQAQTAQAQVRSRCCLLQVRCP